MCLSGANHRFPQRVSAAEVQQEGPQGESPRRSPRRRWPRRCTGPRRLPADRRPGRPRPARCRRGPGWGTGAGVSGATDLVAPVAPEGTPARPWPEAPWQPRRPPPAGGGTCAGPRPGRASLEMPVRDRPRRPGRGGGASGGAGCRSSRWLCTGTRGPGEPDADRGPRTASAPAAGGRTPCPAGGARGGARTQPQRTERMIDDEGTHRARRVGGLGPVDQPRGGSRRRA